MKHGYSRGHKEMAGAYGMEKAVKPRISAKGVYTGKKMARGPKDPKASHLLLRCLIPNVPTTLCGFGTVSEGFAVPRVNPCP